MWFLAQHQACDRPARTKNINFYCDMKKKINTYGWPARDPVLKFSIRFILAPTSIRYHGDRRRSRTEEGHQERNCEEHKRQIEEGKKGGPKRPSPQQPTCNKPPCNEYMFALVISTIYGTLFSNLFLHFLFNTKWQMRNGSYVPHYSRRRQALGRY